MEVYVRYVHFQKHDSFISNYEQTHKCYTKNVTKFCLGHSHHDTSAGRLYARPSDFHRTNLMYGA